MLSKSRGIRKLLEMGKGYYFPSKENGRSLTSQEVIARIHETGNDVLITEIEL
jgi:hypothetical protein